MNDYATVKLYGGPHNNYELVWFEDKKQWFIRSTAREPHSTAGWTQAYSATGYDSKLEATKAFEEGPVTYVAEAPGQS